MSSTYVLAAAAANTGSVFLFNPSGLFDPI